MQKSTDNQIKFAFWSDKYQIGYDSPKDVYFFSNGELYKLKPFVNRSILMYKTNKTECKFTLSYNTLKKSFSKRDYICKLKPLPF
jgi:hypothetical protein